MYTKEICKVELALLKATTYNVYCPFLDHDICISNKAKYCIG